MENNNRDGKIFAVIAIIIMIIINFASCGGSSNSNSGRKWNDLSETEKNNARWAYEAQKYIDSID